MENKKNIVFKKIEKNIMVVKCIEGCPFYIRFNMQTSNQFWQLVSLTDQDSCHMRAKNRHTKTDWLARKSVYTIRHIPEMKIKGLITEAIKKWRVKLSKDQAYRAKKKRNRIYPMC
ncbi:unnamed protein product [Lathyrus sativus]|nr:unnamed protein product [Lathyrus sativus]